MKLPVPEIHTESHNMLNQDSFHVANLGLLFDILRNKMYKNPILAIAREISCNARDAHREIGKEDLPIEIHLPNDFCPEYRIKDWGPGISPERMKIFKGYGDSTKRNDNLQTGGYGLGGKVGFAYSDTWTIITVTDYVKRTYVAYVDESQVGIISLSSEMPTDEENGTTIVIPVKRSDFKEFAKATIDATQHWKVKPKLVGMNPLPQYDVYHNLIQGTKWIYYKVDESDYTPNPYGAYHKYAYKSLFQGTFAIIDGISYRVERENFTEVENCLNLLSGNFLLEFEIGELSLAASRDNIYYDEKTRKLILDRLKVIEAEVSAKIQKKIDDCKTYREACIKYQHLFSENQSYFRDFILNLKWKELALYSNFPLSKIGKYAVLSVWRKNTAKPNKYIREIDLSENTALYVNDVTQEKIDARYYDEIWKLHPDVIKVVILSTPRIPTCWAYKKLIKDGEDKPEVSYDQTWIDLLEFKKLSSITLPKIPREKKESASKKQVEAYVIKPLNNYLTKTVERLPSDQEGVYVVYDYENNTAKFGNIFIYKYYDLSLLSSFIDEQVYGFTELRVKKLGPTWKPLHEVLKEKEEQLLKEISLDELNEAANCSFILKKDIYKNESLLEEVKKLKNKNSLFSKYVELSCTLAGKVKKYENLYRYLYFIDKIKLLPRFEDDYISNYENPNVDTNNSLYLLKKQMYQRYPLLQLLISRGIGDKANLVIDYINLIDEKYSEENV